MRQRDTMFSAIGTFFCHSQVLGGIPSPVLAKQRAERRLIIQQEATRQRIVRNSLRMRTAAEVRDEVGAASTAWVETEASSRVDRDTEQSRQAREVAEDE